MQKYAERRLQEDKAMRDLVQQVAEGHKNSKTVKEKLRKMKQNIGALRHSTHCHFNACARRHWRQFFTPHVSQCGRSRSKIENSSVWHWRRPRLSSRRNFKSSRKSVRLNRFLTFEWGILMTQRWGRKRGFFFKTRHPVTNRDHRMSDCRPRPAGGDVPVWAEGAAGSPEGSTATGPPGETGENLEG